MKKAFTLLELMLVITIIGLLYAGAAAGFTAARRSGRDATRLCNVMLISKAIDQAYLTNHNLYPHNANGGSDSTMCADQILDAAGTNPNNLDLSLFTGRAIPKDPSPATPSVNCANMLNGYTYHTEYGHSGSSTKNLAALQQVNYSLEVGLENQKQQDETTFHSENELQNVNTVVSPNRYRYILNGSYCASTCYN